MPRQLANLTAAIRKTMGMTDIDDKIIARARQTKSSCAEVARFYEREFFNDMVALGVQQPDIVVRVTEHIPQIIEFVAALVQNRYVEQKHVSSRLASSRSTASSAYVAKSGSVMFDLAKYAPHYGQLNPAAGERLRQGCSVAFSPSCIQN
jgi:cysteinyl-tRNA synthetase